MRIATRLSSATLGALAALISAAPAAAQQPPAAPAAPAAPTLQQPPAPAAPMAPAPPAPAAPPAGFVGTNPSGLPTAPVPPPPPAPSSPRPLFGLTTLRVLSDKGILSRDEYESALRDLNDTMGTHAADSTTITVGRWSTTLYGFVQADMMYHSTQSFPDFSSNAPVARPDTYAGSHGRFQASIRDTRFGLRLQAPPLEGVRASGLLEMDFLGPTGTIGTTTTEAGFFNNPNLRVRHAYLKVETPVVDIVFGQTWHLFGWQPNYLPTVVQWPGVVGELFSRTTQLRISHTFKTDPVNVEIAVAGMRPPERDSAVPEGEAGLRFTFNKWTSWHTGYMTATALTPASIAVSGDIRYFRLPEFSATPTKANTAKGMGIAANAYLPVIPATKEKKDNSLSVIGEFVTGRGINDLYTGLTGGVAHAALPNPDMKTPAPEYASPVDAGLAVYDASGVLHVPAWTTFLVGVEYYLPLVGGRVAVFGNVSRTQLHDAATYPNPSKVRDHESFYEGGVLVDPFASLRFGVDYAHIEDVYADGVKAKNETVQVSGFFFF